MKTTKSLVRMELKLDNLCFKSNRRRARQSPVVNQKQQGPTQFFRGVYVLVQVAQCNFK